MTKDFVNQTKFFPVISTNKSDFSLYIYLYIFIVIRIINLHIGSFHNVSKFSSKAVQP